VTVSLEERFWEKVDRRGDEECWPWMASTCGQGYGQIWRLELGRQDLAHRVAYELANGPIPNGLVIDHLCRNVLCVNPAHLEATSQRENSLRGDVSNRRKTQCPKGHSYDVVHRWKDRRAGRIIVARRCSRCRREQEQRRWSPGSRSDVVRREGV
jgi:hypothetical protein